MKIKIAVHRLHVLIEKQKATQLSLTATSKKLTKLQSAYDIISLRCSNLERENVVFSDQAAEMKEETDGLHTKINALILESEQELEEASIIINEHTEQFEKITDQIEELTKEHEKALFNKDRTISRRDKDIEKAEREIEKLTAFKNQTHGLFATDRPSLIKDPKNIMFRIMYQ